MTTTWQQQQHTITMTTPHFLFGEDFTGVDTAAPGALLNDQ